MIKLLILTSIILFMTSCRTTTAKTYYESGKIKSEYKSEGFIPWSNGVGKNLPFSNINVKGVGL